MPAPQDKTKAHYMFSDDVKFFQKAIIFHPSDKTFLTLKRNSSHKNRPNKWDLPGGNIAFGELHEASLRREIEEETGLHVGNLNPLHVVTNFVDDIYYLFIGYKTKSMSDVVVLSDEHVEYRWVTKEQFLELDSADYLVDLAKQL